LRQGILCCGNAVMDIVVRPVADLVWNTTTWVDAIEMHMGGNGANTAFAAAKLGAFVRFISAVGNDFSGSRVLETLTAAGIDTSAIQTLDGATAATVALVNSTGDRKLLHQPGAAQAAFTMPVSFEPALTDAMAFFHLANPFALPGLRRNGAVALRNARAAGLLTSVDAGWDSQGRWLTDLGPCFPHTDFLFVNEDEALRLSGEDTTAAAAARLGSLGARTVVVKLGSRGAELNGSLRVPAYAVEAVDTTGAGDCFAGAFLAAMSRGLSALESTRVANAAAALAISRLGSTAGLRDWHETLRWMETAAVRS